MSSSAESRDPLSATDAPAVPLLPPVDTYLWRIWAKWPRPGQPRRYHSLICHMVDVASVARLMWSRALTPAQRARIAAELGLSEPDAAAWVAFWAGLHDLGKASPAFQTQLKGKARPAPDGDLIAEWLRAAGLTTMGATWAPHGAISLVLLRKLLLTTFGCGKEITKQIAALVGAHHGFFFTPTEIDQCSSPSLKGAGAWIETQERLARLLAAALGLPRHAPQGKLTSGNEMALAGLISVADWIGSNADDFAPIADIVPAPAPRDLAGYVTDATQHAAKALARIAWDRIDLSGQPRDFAQLFPEIQQTRALQDAVIAIAEKLTGPGLVIVESPMGEGKTEAAMYLADHWSVRLGQRGIYFALPTQATSNQMFGRVEQFLNERFKHERRADAQFVNLHLAHGMAALSERYEALREHARLVASLAAASLYDQSEHGGQSARSGEEQPDDDERGAAIAAEWFTAAKRTLLSAYGVGTIDQALLAALQVKHVFVRLFGLGGKTIIVDEAHAYDTYMSTLLGRLLEWLGALGCPVVLLSATLPAARRHTLLERYAQGAGWPNPQIEDQPYPRVTYVSEAVSGCEHVSATAKARRLMLHWIDGGLPSGDDGAFPLADDLAAALPDGGCAAVVCNTVRRAQAMYRALDTAFARLPAHERPELHLLHAQMRHEDRQRCEEFVLDAFGPGKEKDQPNPHRPRRAVLVATQVIEQSLDLDFDLMVSDLAPVDLLLQRAGRVHRHEKNAPRRPDQLRQPTLWLCRPDEREDFTPDFERADEYIYDGHILLRTWHELRSRTHDERAEIVIPGDMETLIETVYQKAAPIPTDADAAFIARWEKSLAIQRSRAEKSESQARQYCILPPGDPGLETAFSRQLDEDNPEAHATLQAQTREGDMRLPVVLLKATEAAGFKRSAQPTLAEARALLGKSINLSHKGLIKLLLAEDAPRDWRVPSGFARTPWLRNHRVIKLNAAGQATFRGGERSFTLTLDPTLGVMIASHRE